MQMILYLIHFVVVALLFLLHNDSKDHGWESI